MSIISPKNERLLNRDRRAIIHFSDVFDDTGEDFDAQLTAIIRNLGNLSDKTYGIGSNVKRADYGVNLVSDLIEEEKRLIAEIQKRKGKPVHQDLIDKAVLAIANCAPRNGKTTANGKNGNDFHLAITNSEVEIYAVPLVSLKTLETRNQILSLFKIPTKNIPYIEALLEQFRSSVITLIRNYPELLEPVFEYDSEEEVNDAKNLNEHPEVIPGPKNNAEFAYNDHFGNVRIFVKDNEKFRDPFINRRFGDTVFISVGNSKKVEAIYARALSDIPAGKLGIYQNPADTEKFGSGYWEIAKKSDDPNNEISPAVKILEKLNPNFQNEEIKVTA